MDVSVRIAIQRQRIKFETFLNEELTLIDPWVSSRPLNVTACPYTIVQIAIGKD